MPLPRPDAAHDVPRSAETRFGPRHLQREVHVDTKACASKLLRKL